MKTVLPGFTPGGPPLGPPPPPPQSLHDAATAYRAVIHGDGGHCPCCHRWGKVMKRRVNETMARALMWMYKYHQLGWVDMPVAAPRWAIRNREYTRLHYWGLVELQPNVADPSKRTTGVWRVTLRGEQWLQGSVRIAKAVYVFDDHVMDRTPETVALADCFGVHFDYAVLMAGL